MIRDAGGARPGPTGPDGPPALLGRAAEQELLAGALAHLPHTGAALVLRGAARIGKTALLDWVVARGRAAGLRVLRMTGSETESPHAYAALHQIIWPLGAHLAALPAGPRPRPPGPRPGRRTPRARLSRTRDGGRTGPQGCGHTFHGGCPAEDEPGEQPADHAERCTAGGEPARPRRQPSAESTDQRPGPARARPRRARGRA